MTVDLAGNRWVESFNERFDQLLAVTEPIIAVFIILQSIIIIANVIVRQFGSEIGLANKTAQVLIIWMTLLVAAQQAQEKAHFDIDIIIRMSSDRVEAFTELVRDVFGVLFAILLLLSALVISIQTVEESSASGFPLFLLYLPGIIAGVLLLVEHLRQLSSEVMRFNG